jgi:C-terminal processing protease CtpA/Prc
MNDGDSARRLSARPVIVILALALSLPAVAAAQSARPVPQRSFQELVAELDHPSYAVRERATKQLMESPCSQSDLYAQLSSASLSLEQRVRLVRVSQHRLVSIPRGALGISMPQFRPAGRVNEPIPIEVTDLHPGLPAERVLRVGDIITHIDGRQLMHQEELRNYVQLRRPGDVVKLTVKRARIGEDGLPVINKDGLIDHEEIEVDLTLGSVERLKEQEDARNPGASDSEIYNDRVDEAREIAEEYGVTPPRVPFVE